MTLLSQLAALAAIVGTGVVYGTDVFCALVQRPALARLPTPPSPRSWGTFTASQIAACPLQESSASSQPSRLPVSPGQPTGQRQRRQRQRRASSWWAGWFSNCAQRADQPQSHCGC
jgi:hypothetical protein